MKNIFVVFGILVVLMFGCTDKDGARSILQSQGYTDVQITGYEFTSCGKDDSLHTGFSAKSPAGIQVTGAVCCGLLFKNCTIRFSN